MCTDLTNAGKDSIIIVGIDYVSLAIPWNYGWLFLKDDGMSKKHLKGFTLLELIIVTAVVGIITSILVPAIITYTRKAAAKNDITNARQIYNSAKNVLAKDPEAYNSFYRQNTMKSDVVVSTLSEVEKYKLVVVCKYSAMYMDNDSSGWRGENKEAQAFCKALNKDPGFVEIERTASMKLTSHSGSNKTNLWLICYRDDDPEHIEIWSGWSNGQNECGPAYRIYPSPDKEYTNPSS